MQLVLEAHAMHIIAHLNASLSSLVRFCLYAYNPIEYIYIPTLFSSSFAHHERIVDIQHDSCTEELSHQPVPFKVKDYIFADTSRELDTGIAREPGSNGLDQRRNSVRL